MKVITFGVFDFFHYGHLKLLKNCKEFGDYLIVAIQDNDEILVNKPNATILYSTSQRKEIIESLRFVDEVIVYKQIDQDIKNIDFDVLVIGGDQNHSGFKKAIEWAQNNGKIIKLVKRTPNISSSEIKGNLK